MKRIDTRGRSCPEPVLLAKKGIEDNSKEVEVLVDNTTAQENVTKFLKHSGFETIKVTMEGEDILINAKK